MFENKIKISFEVTYTARKFIKKKDEEGRKKRTKIYL